MVLVDFPTFVPHVVKIPQLTGLLKARAVGESFVPETRVVRAGVAHLVQAGHPRNQRLLTQRGIDHGADGAHVSVRQISEGVGQIAPVPSTSCDPNGRMPRVSAPEMLGELFFRAPESIVQTRQEAVEGNVAGHSVGRREMGIVASRISMSMGTERAQDLY